jgi:hypothetical protein
MKIGIIDADLLDHGTRHPNLALMKISAYHKSIGDTVELIEDYKDTKFYKKIYVSKVFSFTNVPKKIFKSKKYVLGGTGLPEYDKPLNLDIEHTKPDYDLYHDYVKNRIQSGIKKENYYKDYINYSIGFVTRGCFRKCDFCVNKKYDRAVIHSPVDEFLDEDKPYIYLWDDNFLAFSGWRAVLEDLIATNKPFQFRQGLDIRLMTESKAKILSKVKYHGDFIFAFDHIEDAVLIQKKLKIWKKHVRKTTKLYVLVAYDSTDIIDIENAFKRIKILMKHGCLPYIMRYEKYKESIHENLYIQLARWCNQPSLFKKMSFRQFAERNQFYHKNKDTNCKCYNTFLYYEEKYPKLAKEYFDLRFEDLNIFQEM